MLDFNTEIICHFSKNTNNTLFNNNYQHRKSRLVESGESNKTHTMPYSYILKYLIKIITYIKIHTGTSLIKPLKSVNDL
ncbi:hypothetical protein HNQ59_002889 [Chitinivorax tropicus]|uniref:Uncharacterized protein n=1 Tax=Chitinivorax tropicus TaxID=714531 RepID=A0A840MR58_9PROT|nr:hypothetical protein [Chitinivorax tropicus]